MEQRWTDSFYIGAWLVQPQLNRMTIRDRTVQVEPKIMRVLVCLVERPGAVITREELLDTVWADTVVGEEVLSRSISELRKAFDDDARAPRFIETIPKSGYRLIAPVSFAEDRGDHLPRPVLTVETPPPVVSPTQKKTRPRRWVRAAVVAFGGLVLLVLGAWVFLRSITGQSFLTSPLASSRTMPVTSFPGVEIDPALSPDGQQVAFVWSGGARGHLNVYAKVIGTETPLQLTDDMLYEFSPVWSPDGRQIAFARSLEGLFVVPALGGPERKLADIGRSSSPDLAWSPRGEVIVFSDRASSQEPYSLYLLNVETRERTRLTTPPAAYAGDRNPTFSADGTRVAFTRGVEGANDLYVVPVAGGEPRRLTFDNLHIDGLAWPGYGGEIVFSSNRGGTYGLWRIALSSYEPKPLTLGAGNLRDPSVAIRGDRLAYTQSFVETNIWRIPPADAAAPTPLISSTRWDSNPQVSPDGRYIAFASSRSGSTEIWMCDRDGANPVRLTSFDGPHTSTPRWSPDGRQVAFTSWGDGLADLYVVDVEGGLPQRITPASSVDVAPSWSRNQQWIYFASNRSGTWQVWKMSAEGGEAVQVTERGGFVAFEAPDGQSIYYTRRDTAGLWQRPFDGGGERLVIEDLSRVHAGNWAVTDAGIYFVNGKKQPAAIDFFDFATGQITQAAVPAKAPTWNEHGFAVAPDGEILYAQVDHSHHDIMVMDYVR